MTPIIGLIIAIVAARVAPHARGLLTAVLALMVAATAVQSWDLGAGLGANPPSTIREVSYWVVQAAIITITLAIAFGLFVLRRRRAEKSGTSLRRPSFTGRKGFINTTLLGTVMTVVGIAFCLVQGALRSHPGTGNGNIPWTGVVGIGVGLIVLVGLFAAATRERLGAVADGRMTPRTQPSPATARRRP